LERLIRYCARTPFALDRLHLVGGRSDQILYLLPKPDPAGRTYEGRPGMRGPAFGLYWLGDGTSELVGLCTFARICNPAWADITFEPSADDLTRYSAGMMSEPALRNRLVAESEYLELNRLALVDADATSAPILKGASSWFVSQCLDYFDVRNRSLWAAQSALEAGQPVPAGARTLLERARLEEPGKGLGFLKAVVSFADPWEGHVGK
jgi:hypothetical protein